MPPALDPSVKEQVRRLWFLGETRRNIAETCGIGAGSVTNIIDEWKKSFDSSDYESIRELAVQLKKEGVTFTELVNRARLYNFIKKVGANEEQIESLIANLLDGARSLPQEKIVDLVNMLFELSKSESIPPTEVPEYINRKIEEKARLDAEIQKLRAILDQESVDVQTIEEYKKLEEILKSFDLSMDDPRKLISVLQKFDDMGYDSRKIVTNCARIKSFRQTERRVRKSCKIWESRAARYKEVLPMCERVASGGIGISLLLALEIAAIKKTELDGVPAGSAPYRIMQDIEDYDRLGGMKKQLNEMIVQINVMKEFLGRQEYAINTFLKLQLYGMTEDQILNICKTIERNGGQSMNLQTPIILNKR